MGVKLSIDTYLFDEYLVGSEKQVQYVGSTPIYLTNTW